MAIKWHLSGIYINCPDKYIRNKKLQIKTTDLKRTMSQVGKILLKRRKFIKLQTNCAFCNSFKEEKKCSEKEIELLGEDVINEDTQAINIKNFQK